MYLRHTVDRNYLVHPVMNEWDTSENEIAPENMSAVSSPTENPATAIQSLTPAS